MATNRKGTRDEDPENYQYVTQTDNHEDSLSVSTKRVMYAPKLRHVRRVTGTSSVKCPSVMCSQFYQRSNRFRGCSRKVLTVAERKDPNKFDPLKFTYRYCHWCGTSS